MREAGSWAIPAVVIVIAAIRPAEAQTRWDDRQYAELILEAQALELEATTLPPDAVEARRALLAESSRAKLRAYRMLSGVLRRGGFDPHREQADTECFALLTSLLETLLEIDQCAAAELLLQEAQARPEIYPPEAPDVFQGLRPSIDACRERVSDESNTSDPGGS